MHAGTTRLLVKDVHLKQSQESESSQIRSLPSKQVSGKSTTFETELNPNPIVVMKNRGQDDQSQDKENKTEERGDDLGPR